MDHTTSPGAARPLLAALLLVACCVVRVVTEQPQSVAVVGAGFAGASTAYFLHKKGQSRHKVEIFEADRVGGRAREVTYKDQTLELGASIVWEKNFYILDTAKELGLDIVWLNGDSSEKEERKAARKQQQQQQQQQAGTADDPTAAQQPSETAGAGSDTAKTAAAPGGSSPEVHTGTESVTADSVGSSNHADADTPGGEADDDDDDDDWEDGLAIWDGKNFVMTQTTGSLWELASLFFRYGPAAHIFGQHAIKVWEDNFKPIYDLQNQGTAFSTPQALLNSTGLWQYTQENCVEHMQSVLNHWYVWGQGPFTEELAGSINRCNYNQPSSTMNALAGLVSYLPAAANRVFAIKGGNSLLAAAMINATNATLHTGTRVTAVTQQSDGTYMLTVGGGNDSSGGDDAQQYGPYDSVVLASPLELSKICVQLHSDDSDKGGSCVAWTRQYQTTVTTFVVGGRLQPEPFHVEQLPTAQSILVTEHADSDFSSISVVKRIGKERVYKVFSTTPLPTERILELFGPDAKVLESKVWSAYPVFAPPERFSPFLLAPGLCYASALENSASAMEVAMIAGRNCALLLSSTGQEHLGSSSQEDASTSSISSTGDHLVTSVSEGGGDAAAAA